MTAGAAALAAAGLVAAAVVLLGRPAVDVPQTAARRSAPVPAPPGPALVARYRVLLAGLAAAGGVTLVSGTLGWVVGGGLAAAVWWVAARAEPPSVRGEREVVRRELPHVVGLLATALAAGASPAAALEQVADALPGPATDALRLARSRLALGVPPSEVWSEIADQSGLEPLGRALSRAEGSGARIADTVRRLAQDLAREARCEVEDRARTVGIRAAVPLGVCLLPAFLLVGIVPVVAATAAALRL